MTRADDTPERFVVELRFDIELEDVAQRSHGVLRGEDLKLQSGCTDHHSVCVAQSRQQSFAVDGADRLTLVEITTALGRMKIDQLLELSSSINHSRSFSDKFLEDERDRICDDPEEVDQHSCRYGHDRSDFETVRRANRLRNDFTAERDQYER